MLETVDGMVCVKVWRGGRGGARRCSSMPMDMRARQIEAWMCRSQRGRGAIVGGRELVRMLEWPELVLRRVCITITALRPAQQSAQKKGIVFRFDENIGVEKWIAAHQ